MVVVGLLRGVAFLMSMIASGSYYAGAALISIYDLIIFMPLWIEGLIKGRTGSEAKKGLNLFESHATKEV